MKIEINNRLTINFLAFLLCFLSKNDILSQTISTTLNASFLTTGDDIATGYNLVFYDNIKGNFDYGIGFSSKRSKVNSEDSYNSLVVSGGNTSINNFFIGCKIGILKFIDLEVFTGTQKYVKYKDGGIILIQSGNGGSGNYYQTTGSLINNFSFFYGSQLDFGLLKKSNNDFGISSALNIKIILF